MSSEGDPITSTRFEEPPREGRNPLTQHRWTAVLAIAVASLVVAAGLYATSRPPPQSLPTFQAVFDSGEDLDGDGYPDRYPQYGVGDEIRIRDEIRDFFYFYAHPRFLFPGWSGWGVMFPYIEGRWQFWYPFDEAFALVDDDLGAFKPGDSIDLVGRIDSRTPENTTYEVIIWKVVDGLGLLTPPILTIRNATVPGAQYAIEFATTDRRTALVHYEAQLLWEGFGIDVMRLEDGRGLHMEFRDSEESQYLDAGDSVVFTNLDPGNYTVLLTFFDIFEVVRGSFVLT